MMDFHILTPREEVYLGSLIDGKYAFAPPVKKTVNSGVKREDCHSEGIAVIASDITQESPESRMNAELSIGL